MREQPGLLSAPDVGKCNHGNIMLRALEPCDGIILSQIMHAVSLSAQWTCCVPIAGRDMELEFEIPFRELGFSGVPHRTASNVMPTRQLPGGSPSPRLAFMSSYFAAHSQTTLFFEWRHGRALALERKSCRKE